MDLWECVHVGKAFVKTSLQRACVLSPLEYIEKNNICGFIHFAVSTRLTKKRAAVVFAKSSRLLRSTGWKLAQSLFVPPAVGSPRRREVCFLMLPMLLYLRILLEDSLGFLHLLESNLCGKSDFVMVSCFSSVTRLVRTYDLIATP